MSPIVIGERVGEEFADRVDRGLDRRERLRRRPRVGIGRDRPVRVLREGHAVDQRGAARRADRQRPERTRIGFDPRQQRFVLQFEQGGWALGGSAGGRLRVGRRRHGSRRRAYGRPHQQPHPDEPHERFPHLACRSNFLWIASPSQAGRSLVALERCNPVPVARPALPDVRRPRGDIGGGPVYNQPPLLGDRPMKKLALVLATVCATYALQAASSRPLDPQGAAPASSVAAWEQQSPGGHHHPRHLGHSARLREDRRRRRLRRDVRPGGGRFQPR